MNPRYSVRSYFDSEAAKKLLARENFQNLKKISMGKKNARWK